MKRIVRSIMPEAATDLQVQCSDDVMRWVHGWALTDVSDGVIALVRDGASLRLADSFAAAPGKPVLRNMWAVLSRAGDNALAASSTLFDDSDAAYENADPESGYKVHKVTVQILKVEVDS